MLVPPSLRPSAHPPRGEQLSSAAAARLLQANTAAVLFAQQGVLSGRESLHAEPTPMLSPFKLCFVAAGPGQDLSSQPITSISLGSAEGVLPVRHTASGRSGRGQGIRGRSWLAAVWYQALLDAISPCRLPAGATSVPSVQGRLGTVRRSVAGAGQDCVGWCLSWGSSWHRVWHSHAVTSHVSAPVV